MFFGFFNGCVKYKIKCERKHELIDAVRQNAVVRGIKTIDDDSVEFYVLYRDRKTVDKILDNINCEISETKSKGFGYFVSGYKRRAGLAAGMLVTLLMLFFSAQYVWDIRVEGNDSVKASEIIELLEKNGFGIGVKKNNVDTKSVVNMLLVADDRISWAAINFDGTVAHVEVKEARIAVREDKKENVNLVASHDGIIIRTDALSGSATVKKGDAVIKGQMLVSAFVEKRTGGYLLKGARGNVWANTKRTYAVAVPLEYKEKIYTGNSEKRYSISFLGKSFDLTNITKKKFANADSRTFGGKLKVFEKIVLPVEIHTWKISEYEPYTCRRTEKEALAIAENVAEQRLKADSPGFVMIDKTESYSIDDFLVYECTFEGVENIAVPLEFGVS